MAGGGAKFENVCGSTFQKIPPPKQIDANNPHFTSHSLVVSSLLHHMTAAAVVHGRLKKRTMSSSLRRNAVLLLLLASSALAKSSASYDTRSLAKTGSNIDETYANNSEGHTLQIAVFGCIAAVGVLAGLLFLVDREVSARARLYTELKYMITRDHYILTLLLCQSYEQLFNSKCACASKCAPIKCNFSCIRLKKQDVDNDLVEDQYVNYELAKKTIGINQTNDNDSYLKPWLNFTCEKHQISYDEGDINEAYITAETKQYLAEQKKSKSWSRKLLPFLYKTKEYDETDKYKERHADPTEIAEVSEDEQTIVSVLSAQMEEVRLRLFWKPTKDYDVNDKYAVTMKDSDVEEPVPDASSPYAHANKVPVCPWEVEEEIKPKNSSYESSDSTVVPYK